MLQHVAFSWYENEVINLLSRIRKNVVSPKPSVLRAPRQLEDIRSLKGLSLALIMTRLVLLVVGCLCLIFELLPWNVRGINVEIRITS